MDSALTTEQLRASYRGHSERYRRDDEIEVSTAPHQRLRRILHRISTSFAHPIRALDVGCGTGRYFYCLANVEQLVGLDLSPEMLRAAEHPVRQEEIAAGGIRLICANVFDVAFPPRSFDFIYSLGMFGFGCPVTPGICNRFHRWLRPGGQLFFDTLDSADVHWTIHWRRRIRKTLARTTPPGLRRLIPRQSGAPLCDLTAAQLDAVIRATPFQDIRVTSTRYSSPVWQTIKLECHAAKATE